MLVWFILEWILWIFDKIMYSTFVMVYDIAMPFALYSRGKHILSYTNNNFNLNCYLTNKYLCLSIKLESKFSQYMVKYTCL